MNNSIVETIGKIGKHGLLRTRLMKKKKADAFPSNL